MSTLSALTASSWSSRRATPVSFLSAAQLAKIFSGEIRDWSEVGAPSGKIRIYAPGDKSGTFSTFRSLVLKPRKLKIAADAQRFVSYAKIAELIANDQRGIGITGFAHKGETKPLAIRNACGMMQKPSIFNVKTGEYPLSRNLYLYTAQGARKPSCQGFAEVRQIGGGSGSVVQARLH